MKIIEIVDYEDEDFLCPVTEEIIVGPENGFEPSKAQVAVWQPMGEDNPHFYKNDLEKEWNAFEAECDNDNCKIVQFLRSVDRPNYICFEITDPGMGAGSGYTAWHVIDMDYQASSELND